MSNSRDSRQRSSRDIGDPKLIQSVERALTMLEEVAASPAPLSAAEVARRAGVNRGTAWRLLATLEHFGYVDRATDGRTYELGHAPARISAMSPGVPIARRSRNVLDGLAAELDECVYLMGASGQDLVVLDEVRGTRPVSIDLTRLRPPLHCGSVGKAYLACLPDDEIEDYLAGPLESFTGRTVTDPDALRLELSQVRRDGYAVAYQEHLPDWAGISAAVCDEAGRPIVYLNVTVQTFRYSETGLQNLAAPLLQAQEELRQRLLSRSHDRQHLPGHEPGMEGSST